MRTMIAVMALFAAGGCAAGAKERKDPAEEEKRADAAARLGMRDEIKERTDAAMADRIFTNANVITLDPATPKAEAIAVKGERILAVGTRAEVEKTRGRGTEVVDLGGATVIPGLVDGHAHLASLGETLETVNLVDTTSWKQVVELVAARAKTTPKGEWILGDGWDQNDWGKDTAFPSHEALSAAVPDHPVFLSRIDGHAAIVNAKALALAKVPKDVRDTPGGKVIRAKDGSFTGVFVDDAMALVANKIPAATVAQVKARIEKAQAKCLELGLTGIHDAGVGETGLQAYEELVKEGKLAIRVYAMLAHDDALLEKRFAAGPVIGDRLTVRSVKLFVDGALGSRGAALLAPYDDDKGNTGLLRMDASEIESVTTKALAAGFQVNAHAIGDRANRAALNGYERALAASPAAKDARLRIEHAQVLAPEDIPRFAKLGVIASMQPTHATSDGPWVEARVGKARAKGAYAWRSLKKTGARLAFGSDFPVEGVSPLWGLHAAVTRVDRKGWPGPEGWLPEEKLTVQEALEAFTVGTAWAAFEETKRGTITAGKLADFTVLSKDPLAVPASEVLSLQIEKTIVGGAVAYSK